MYAESDYVMLSALQHYLFCPRQCALIHLEQIWTENRYTAEGRILHERVDSREREVKSGVRIVRTLHVRSARLGLSGQADVVEFHADGRICPVEYKRGRPKSNRCDEVQLCAQALCLEEMLGKKIDDGALFYGQNKRRRSVAFNDELRRLTEETVAQVHHLFRTGITPKAVYSAKCDQCSLIAACLPKSCTTGRSVRKYLAGMLRGADHEKDAQHALRNDARGLSE
ncbi:CRISPR-associated protein Cas4 [Geoalkalibacter halelectricus]|uniref:CRISPR-associated exonuclease Cas4 n=1 Tax=Geoalkalibacter halelectricus TaxID=2847045 RepID=A0ABY5ZQF1_9BACT|nr:CRISPR-associated protein Cas4 [Geoalkalibacter halelectricus]MDO3377601.1 CRISPR-associated protein Cas4 [Geoalkalibacter halelectricus]UWZ81392.1 CRISPR-associated protein Cas4 [Geoalkalibacter halelectricus]